METVALWDIDWQELLEVEMTAIDGALEYQREHGPCTPIRSLLIRSGTTLK